MWSNAIISNMLCKLDIYYVSFGVVNPNHLYTFQTEGIESKNNYNISYGELKINRFQQ